MLTVAVILVFGIAMISIIVNGRKYDWNSDGWIVVSAFSSVLFFVALIAEIIGISTVVGGVAIDDKIEICETENANIENSVCIAVETYLQHENITYDKLSNANATTFVGIFPELSSSEIVVKQVEIINENNKRIRELKEEKANLRIWKFLIYFGH